jgi:hypothetical protein
MRTRVLSSALVLAALAAGPARAQFQPPALDHFTVYDATGQLNPPIATFQDQFQIQTRDLGPTVFLLVPARKNAEPLLDPISHLTCYQLPTGSPPPLPLPPQITIRHQFANPTTLTLGPAFVACIPTEKFPPQQVTIDHFVCYQATGPTLSVGATFLDQFQGFTHQLTTPFMFCSPATKGLGAPPLPDLPPPVMDPTSHLACYNITPFAPPPAIGEVPIRNQFGTDLLTLQQRRFACLPATKEPPTGALDHFLYRRALGDPGGAVTVVDQFGPQPSLVLGPVKSFLVPADKNSEGIVDIDSHLTGYVFPGVPPPATIPRVIAHNQFGSQVIELGPAEELWVPTRKLLGPAQNPPSIDHFNCYQATGHSLDILVTVQDQFIPGPNPRLVREPFLFCNPADKNEEGALNLEDHLTCFRLDPPGVPFGTVPINNQFSPVGAPHLIQVFEDLGLCVPSEKEIPTIAIPSLSAWGVATLAAVLFAVTLGWARRKRALPAV